VHSEQRRRRHRRGRPAGCKLTKIGAGLQIASRLAKCRLSSLLPLPRLQAATGVLQSLGYAGGVERTGDGAHESRREDAGEGEGEEVKTGSQKALDAALEEFDAAALVVTCLQRALWRPC
jgi:hypothetical protein